MTTLSELRLKEESFNYDHYNYERRVKGVLPFIYKRTSGDKDLMQEAFLKVYETLTEYPEINNSYLRTSISWRICNVLRNGKSVDNSTRKRQTPIEIVPFADRMSAMFFTSKGKTPLDEKVITKISFERFIDSLTELEMHYVEFKLKGYTVSDFRKVLEVSEWKAWQIRKSLRLKFWEVFEA